MTRDSAYTSRLTNIGKKLGVSAVQVGKMLREAGLRTEKGFPTPKAIAEGLARSTWDGQDRKYDWCVQTVLAKLKPILAAGGGKV